MGIRFYCPNGHRLHVKSFLAGKRGICPHCASRFRIPPASEIPRGAPKLKPESAAAATLVKPARTFTSPVAESKSAEDHLPVGDRQPAVERQLVGRSAAVADGPDPIAEAPDAVWYVRPPSGGQFGPAKGEVMRRWIEEGRVSSDSLVWREGWADWQTAGPVFPSLGSTYTSRTSPALRREAISLQLQPMTSLTSDGLRPASTAVRTTSRSKSLAAVIILVLIVVVLVGVLVLVLTNRS